MAGFIYIMSNPAFEAGLVKIGKTSKDPEEHRKGELESTGVPGEFKVEYYAFVDNYDNVELSVHRSLDSCRYSKNREFFRIGVPEAVNAIRAASGNSIKYEKLFHVTEEQLQKEIAEIRKKMAEIQKK